MDPGIHREGDGTRPRRFARWKPVARIILGGWSAQWIRTYLRPQTPALPRRCTKTFFATPNRSVRNGASCAKAGELASSPPRRATATGRVEPRRLAGWTARRLELRRLVRGRYQPTSRPAVQPS